VVVVVPGVVVVVDVDVVVVVVSSGRSPSISMLSMKTWLVIAAPITRKRIWKSSAPSSSESSKL
jgi:hypothetical protein